jgi:very-short-patch-repair endonuclease
MSRRLTKEQFVIMSHNVHGEIYDYSNVDYKTAKTKVSVVCKRHGEFMVTPDNHLRRKSGCPLCGNICTGKRNSDRLKGKSHNNFVSTIGKRKKNFLDRARNKHGDRYDYSKVIYKSNKDLIIVICKSHGEFNTLPCRHIHGSGCPSCAVEKRRKSEKDFLAQALELHGDKYDYSKINYISASDKIEIVCNIHGSFYQKPMKHLFGQGCPACKESHGEKKIAKWFKDKGISIERQKRFDGCINPKTRYGLKFDFFVESLNLCIEFDGEQHFNKRNDGIYKGKFEGIVYRDKIKERFCKENNIKLLRIPYTLINKIDEVLSSVDDPLDKYDIVAYVS